MPPWLGVYQSHGEIELHTNTTLAVLTFHCVHESAFQIAFKRRKLLEKDFFFFFFQGRTMTVNYCTQRYIGCHCLQSGPYLKPLDNILMLADVMSRLLCNPILTLQHQNQKTVSLSFQECGGTPNSSTHKKGSENHENLPGTRTEEAEEWSRKQKLPNKVLRNEKHHKIISNKQKYTKIKRSRNLQPDKNNNIK